MVKFSDLNVRQQRLVSGNALALQLLKESSTVKKSVVQAIFLRALTLSNEMSDEQIYQLMVQLDEYCKGKAKPFVEFKASTKS